MATEQSSDIELWIALGAVAAIPGEPRGLGKLRPENQQRACSRQVPLVANAVEEPRPSNGLHRVSGIVQWVPATQSQHGAPLLECGNSKSGSCDAGPATTLQV